MRKISPTFFGLMPHVGRSNPKAVAVRMSSSADCRLPPASLRMCSSMTCDCWDSVVYGQIISVAGACKHLIPRAWRLCHICQLALIISCQKTSELPYGTPIRGYVLSARGLLRAVCRSLKAVRVQITAVFASLGQKCKTAKLPGYTYLPRVQRGPRWQCLGSIYVFTTCSESFSGQSHGAAEGILSVYYRVVLDTLG